MNDESTNKKNWIFWVVCILGLLWNVGGSINYLMQTTFDLVQSMPENHQAIIVGRPAWATGGFALGVFGGALGCILLMMLNRLSLPVFYISLAGIVLTMIHTANVAMSEVEFTVSEIFVMAVLPVIVAAGLAAYARHALAKYGGG